MENLEKIERMLSTANGIVNGIEKYKMTIKKPNVDKFGMGFNKDDRFSAATIKISVDSWTGYYGSSSCGTFLSITDKDIFKKNFIKVLNVNFDRLMLETARWIKDDALKYKDAAENELKERLNMLNKLSGGQKEKD